MFASVIEPMQRQLSKQIASTYFHRFACEDGNCGFSIRLTDGTTIMKSSQPRFTLVIAELGVLGELLNSPDELKLGELFISGALDVEGDMNAALQFADSLISHPPRSGELAILQRLSFALPNYRQLLHSRDENLKGDMHSRERDRAAISSHYDISNDFYSLWLDSSMVYSEAYFASADEDLETAQIRKLDYICRKLKLQPGDKFLDIGCGWGGLVMHAASHFGVEAFGITLSFNQAQLARQRIRVAGLEDHCAIRVCDYRDLGRREAYDKVASIGMFEHVGKSMLGLYFEQVFQFLRPGGLFLNSGISASATYPTREPSFIDKYVFPDGELVPLHTAIEKAEISGFEARDVENLREHYALTLDHWARRLEQYATEARRVTDEVTYRTWKLYMAASAYAFRAGRINLYQMLLSKPDRDHCHLQVSRKDWRQV
jgi:cyclopropane-fatty-acyl-phospholipid synthase